MAKVDHEGFLKYKRQLPAARPVQERIKDYKEIESLDNPDLSIDQSTRCMDCGVPFCHSGCPLGNLIPDFNEAVAQEDWKTAFKILIGTNNFPEFTGRICPAPCEAACVLGINNNPVTIEYIEKSIIEKAFDNNWVQPSIPANRTGKSIAIVGSGPAGLAAAEQLNMTGHYVTVFERSDRPGGLLRYGIPDFKLEKQIIDRRIDLMKASGIQFTCNAEVGKDISVESIESDYDAILLATGASVPRDLPIRGRNAKGIHFAMEYLDGSNRYVAGDLDQPNINAHGKDVVVIGGGDTGSDCVGTANRQGAASITQIELMAKPPLSRDEDSPWPLWPMTLRTSSSHEEGCEREWSVLTKAFVHDKEGRLTALKLVEIEWTFDSKQNKTIMQEIPGTERDIPCQLALLAVGFLHGESSLPKMLGVELDDRGNVRNHRFQTNKQNIFVAGDASRGQSLVVWAISEGREAAAEIDANLTGQYSLPSKEKNLMMV